MNVFKLAFWTFLALIPIAILAGCAHTSRLHAQDVPNGSIRLVEVDGIAEREEILSMPLVYSSFTEMGITDSEIRDGSLASGRAYCCGGPIESIWFFVPRPLKVSVGDVVEVWSGAPVKRGDQPTTQPNTAIRIHPKLSSAASQCRWEPEDPRLWLRVLHCDWMENTGWIQQDSALYPIWVNPANLATPPAASTSH